MSELPIDKNSFVSTLAMLGMRALGPESLDWEPEILRDAFEDAYGIDKLSQRLFDKLNCGYMLIGTDAFTSSIEAFLSATAVMNNMVFEADEVPYCTFEMCAWSVWEYINLMGDIEDGKPTDQFSPDIILYIQQTANENGISRFPLWLKFAEPENSLPDLSGDIEQFEMYQERQNDRISDMNGFVTRKQEELTEELTNLQKLGFLG